MSFVYPVFLTALAALAIPVIIHLFNFRRYRTVYFTNVQFLKEVKEETTSRSKLKHLLVLFSRLLALTFLVLAFAQPYIPVMDAETTNTDTQGISIYVDNSFSMSAESDGEPLINQAKRKAREIISAYDATQKFQVLSNDLEARQQLFLSKEEALTLVDELEPSPRYRSLKDIYSVEKKAFTDKGIEKGLAYWISDFQESITDFTPDTSLNVSLVPLKPSNVANLYIDSVWLEKPVVYSNEPNRLMVRITNTGDEAVLNSRVSLKVNGQVKGISDIDVEAGSFGIDTLNFTINEDGWQQAEVSIMDHPIVFDDTWFLTFPATGVVNVLAIDQDQPSPYLQALYGNTERFKFDKQQVNALNYSSLGKYNLIVLNDLTDIPSGLSYELEQYLQAGGTILVFPSANATISSYNKLFNTLSLAQMVGITNEEAEVGLMNREHQIFKDVFETVPRNIDLPQAKVHFTFTKNGLTSEQRLLSFRDGASFLSEYSYRSGKVFISSVPLDKEYTDFPYHAIFVPLLYKMALTGGQLQDLSNTIGQAGTIIVPDTSSNSEMPFKLRSADNEFIPQQKSVAGTRLLTLNEDMMNAGIYSVIDGQGNTVALTALNFDRKESMGKHLTAQQLKDKYPQEQVYVFQGVDEDLSGLVNELDRGVTLWKLCIIFALIFLGAEVLLLRFLK